MYTIQFQAFDAPLAILGQTADLAFARQLMLVAFQQLATPGQFHNMQDKDGSGRLIPESIREPIIALYKGEVENRTFIESIGWTEEGVS